VWTREAEHEYFTVTCIFSTQLRWLLIWRITIPLGQSNILYILEVLLSVSELKRDFIQLQKITDDHKRKDYFFLNHTFETSTIKPSLK